MENISVSKGVFASTSYTFGQKRTKNEFSNEPWHLAYRETWSTVESAAKDINNRMFRQILEDLHSFVSMVKTNSMKVLQSEIPTAILLAGINLPDHVTLFQEVVSTLHDVTAHIATLSSTNCNNIKHIMEETVYQLINATSEDKPSVKRTHCTYRALNAWYKELNQENETDEPLVIIVTDFEHFSTKVLHDFVYNLSTYSSTVKFVLVFGVATTAHIVHRSLSYDVTSKLRVKVFPTQTQLKRLSKTLEGTVFSHKIPFKLTGNVFNLLQDMFLFYDFSVDGFIQEYKICMIRHYFENNFACLCCAQHHTKKKIMSFTEKDIEDLKTLPSIACYLKGREELRGKAFKEFLWDRLEHFHNYMNEFLSVLKCLHVLVVTLPGAFLGRHFREIYAKAVSTNLTDTEEYEKSLKLLKCVAKSEFLKMLSEVLEIVQEKSTFLPQGFKEDLEKNLEIIREASLEVISTAAPEILNTSGILIRSQFTENLRQKSQIHSCSPYKTAQNDFIDRLDKNLFSASLKNPKLLIGHEIFCFCNIKIVKYHFRGSLRAAVHTALNDPRSYLECQCCKTTNDREIIRTMPDISIIYKLHLENKKLINMYDWLQSFVIIVDPESNEEERDIDPEIQARFTHAVAELQFLGYIKGSNLKMDHVKRLV